MGQTRSSLRRKSIVDQQGKGHALIAERRVGLKAHVFFIETIIALSAKQAIDATALSVEFIQVERHAHT